MAKIKIKNFGPIREGFTGQDGWIDIKKVTVFIGNQGSGKSTIAKAISTLIWIEKAINRGDFPAEMTKAEFIDFFEFHKIQNYFRKETLIEYEGDKISFRYGPGEQWPIITLKSNNEYAVPKVMYIPSERNLLSSIENINSVANLIHGGLLTYAIEYKNAQLADKGSPVHLPVGDAFVLYEPGKNKVLLANLFYSIPLSEASSGYQSLVPLFWVNKYLNGILKLDPSKRRDYLSADQLIQRNAEIAEISFDENLKEEEKKLKIKNIDAKYISTYLWNVVEEPEQNLFPSSQQKVLYNLLETNNSNKKNTLVITTHSPYLINYLTLAVEANKLKSRVNTAELKAKLNEIVPLNSTLNGDDLVVYELEEKNGQIAKLKTYNGLPTDENYLNKGLAESNDLFSELLDIEDLCQ